MNISKFLDWLDGEREADPNDPHDYGPLIRPGTVPPEHLHTTDGRPFTPQLADRERDEKEAGSLCTTHPGR